MNDEQHLAHFVRQNLNRSARALPDAVVDRLRKVRGEAVAHQKVSVRSAVLASIGARFDLDDLPRQVTGFIAILLISLACAAYWQAQEYIAGLAEVDSAILTDEMPLDAFVDKGFDAWLRATAER